MKYDELQVKLREKDTYVKHLKDQLNESEKKISQLQKVYICVVSIYICNSFNWVCKRGSV